MKAKVWILNKEAKTGLPTLDHFKCIEEEIPDCKDGEIMVEAEYMSVDPYMRYRIALASVGSCIIGSQVARVIQSKSPLFSVGTLLVCHPGWRSRTLFTAEMLKEAMSGGMMWPLSVGKLPKSLGLGILGMPGNTAYFGFLELCDPQPGEFVLVNGAAGAVGSAVCQIAKLKGCTVIAFAGDDQKVAWLKQLGIDHVFNYKKDGISKSLKEVAPKGINCYFDNVGGDFTAEALPHMAVRARISVCGAISTYNEDRSGGKRNGCFNEGLVVVNQLKVEGFIVMRWASRWMEGINQMRKWVEEGKLQYRETHTKGFETVPKAFIGLFSGANTGKAVIEI